MASKKSKNTPISQENRKISLAPPLGTTRDSLPLKVRQKVASILAVHALESIDLYLHIKQAHWNVQGQNFKSVHEFFDEIADETREWGDLLAERVRQLGFEAIGSARAITQHSTLTDYPHGIRESNDHLTAVADRLAEFGKRIRAAIDQTDEIGDADSADICTNISRAADKLLWMVESHL